MEMSAKQKVVKVFDEESQGINIAATLRDPVN